MAWDQKYRQLQKGELIEATDEIRSDDGSWKPATRVGKEAPDPNYTSHRQYRRLKEQD